MQKKLPTIFRVLSLTCSLFLSACSTSDSKLLALSQKVYSQHQLQQPLPPNEFVSDGCSLWPDMEWVECCVVHDLVYWKGGTGSERKQADRAMKQCVSETGHPAMSWFMYYGVRTGGVYWLPTSFRWGFGWEYPQSGPPGIPY